MTVNRSLYSMGNSEQCNFLKHMSCHDMTWHDMIWHDMTWHDMTWYDMTWQFKYLYVLLWFYRSHSKQFSIVTILMFLSLLSLHHIHTFYPPLPLLSYLPICQPRYKILPFDFLLSILDFCLHLFLIPSSLLIYLSNYLTI